MFVFVRRGTNTGPRPSPGLVEFQWPVWKDPVAPLLGFLRNSWAWRLQAGVTATMCMFPLPWEMERSLGCASEWIRNLINQCGWGWWEKKVSADGKPDSEFSDILFKA